MNEKAGERTPKRKMEYSDFFEMANDPEIRVAMSLPDGIEPFTDDERPRILLALFRGLGFGPDSEDSEAYEKHVELFNKCLARLKLYRMHQAFLELVIAGHFMVTGFYENGDLAVEEAKAHEPHE